MFSTLFEARAMPTLMASSKLLSDVDETSMILATDMGAYLR